MGYQPYPYPGYPPYYNQPVPDQLAQLRQNQWSLQNPQQPLVQAPSIGPQNSGIIWVASKQEADNYPVAPNSAMALWDANSPVIYLRQADGTGKPTTKAYDLVERQENQPAPMPQLDPNQFVTFDKLEEILAERLKKPSKPTKPKEDADHE